MPKLQVAISALKVIAEYKKHYANEFNAGAKDARIVAEFKEDLLKGVHMPNTLKQLSIGDFNFMLTRPQAHQVLGYYQERYTKLDDAFAKKAKIWALIIMDLYGERVDANLEPKKEDKQMDGNLFNNMFPILENTLRVIHGLELNEQQQSAVDKALDKLGYISEKTIASRAAANKQRYKELTESHAKLNKERQADQAKIVELENKVKSFNKLIGKLKEAI